MVTQLATREWVYRWDPWSTIYSSTMDRMGNIPFLFYTHILRQILFKGMALPFEPHILYESLDSQHLVTDL